MTVTKRYGKKAKAVSPFEERGRVLASVKKGVVKPVYLLYGGERYLVEQTAEEIIRSILPDLKDWEFGLEVVWDKNLPLREIVNALTMVPLFGRRRVVWLKDCEIFRSPDRASPVREALPKESDQTVVLITERSADRRTTLYREIEKRGSACEFQTLSDADDTHLRGIYEIVTERLKADGKKISRETLFYLVQLAGTDLSVLIAELEKAVLHAGDREEISREDIDLMVIPTRETAAYQLSDCISAGDLKSALLVLGKILRQDGDPLGILAMILKRVRFMLQARELLDAGVITSGHINGGYPVFKSMIGRLPAAVKSAFSRKKSYNLFLQHPYVAYRVCLAARNIPLPVLKRRLGRLTEADGQLKGGRKSKEDALEDLVIDLCLPNNF